MKFRYIIAALAAVVALAAGCVQDEEHYLSQVTVSSSYVAISQDGGSTDITVDATSSWSISGAPEWLTISPANGASGQTKVTFSAPATVDGREDEVLLTCNGAVQHINVIQGLATISKATCKDVVNGIEGKTYLVTGVCTAIANTQYGNWYLNDGTGEVYVYGTVNGSGAYDWASFGIEVGDEVTVQGARKDYNGTIEFVDALFVSVNKSLMKIDDISVPVIPSDGGDSVFKLANKGEGVYVEIPDDAASWLSIKSIAANTVTFTAAPNTGAPRSAVLVFKTKKGGKDYSAEATLSQAGLSGTLAVPFTVSEAIAFCEAPTENDVYVKGIVSKIDSEFAAQFGNATFWISEDGTFNDDKSLDFEAYRVLWLGNRKWVDGDGQIQVGDEVVLCGQLTSYKGTAETNQGKAYVYSINTVTENITGKGTEADPFNVPAAISFCKKLSSATTDDFYVKGKVSKLVSGGFGSEYGNGTFWLSETGEFANDLSKDFEAYRVLWLGNKKWVDGDPQVAPGDEVVLCGQLTNYKGTAETNSGKAYVVSHKPAN